MYIFIPPNLTEHPWSGHALNGWSWEQERIEAIRTRVGNIMELAACYQQVTKA